MSALAAVAIVEQGLKPTAPIFGKKDVLALFDLIAGEGKDLTIQQIDRWHDLIMYAVRSMRFNYENVGVDENYPIRIYYAPCWQMIDLARDNKTMLIEALENLRSMIQWE